MTEENSSVYSQKLLDTIVALRKEIDNLRTAYGIVDQRIEAVSVLDDQIGLKIVKICSIVTCLTGRSPITGKAKFFSV
jgi:hypothetical protein